MCLKYFVEGNSNKLRLISQCQIVYQTNFARVDGWGPVGPWSDLCACLLESSFGTVVFNESFFK